MILVRARWFSLLLLLSSALVWVMLAAAGETVRLGGLRADLLIPAAAVIVAIRFRYRRPVSEAQRVARDAAEYIGLFALICLLGAIASYPEAARTTGFVDPLLERADRAMHFDWIGLYGVVVDHPVLQWVGSIAYQSVFVTPAVLLVWFALADRPDDARRFLLSFWLAAAITLVAFSRLPAVGPLAYLWHGRVPYMPQSALYQAELIPMLRDHAVRTIEVDALHGIVSVPSFHAACAVLYIVAAWRIPRVGVPLVLLNLVMLAATPVEGTHYLVDLVAGAFVALCATAISRFGVNRIDRLAPV